MLNKLREVQTYRTISTNFNKSRPNKLNDFLCSVWFKFQCNFSRLQDHTETHYSHARLTYHLEHTVHTYTQPKLWAVGEYTKKLVRVQLPMHATCRKCIQKTKTIYNKKETGSERTTAQRSKHTVLQYDIINCAADYCTQKLASY